MSQQAHANETHKRALPAWLFYGIILGGLMSGLASCCLGGWQYLEQNSKAVNGSVGDDIAVYFIVPVCAIVGATFGGLIGVSLAIGLTAICKSHSSKKMLGSSSDRLDA
jgi:hypothetical protein